MEKFFEEIKKYVGLIEISNEPDLKQVKYSGFLIGKNLVLTSCHCVTPSKSNNLHYEIIPSNVSFKIQGKTKKVLEIFRFQNYHSLNQIIVDLIKLFNEKKDSILSIREKLKHNLDFSLLLIEEVYDYNCSFLLLPEGSPKNYLKYYLFGYDNNKLESICLNNFKEEVEELGIFSFDPLNSETLRGGVVFAYNGKEYYLYGLNTSSISSKEEKKTKGIRLSRFLREIEFKNKGLEQLLTKLKTMETIKTFSKTMDITNTSKEAFFSYFMPHIETLILEDNDLLPDLHYFLNLKSLIINNFKELSASFLKKIPLLIELKKLRLCNINNINFYELFKIFKTSKLEKLALKSVSINNESLKFITNTTALTNLKELNLSHNNISFSVDLFTFIERLRSLKKLDLSFNPIGNKGLNVLSFSFKSLINLTYLNLSFLNLNNEEKSDIFNKNLSQLVRLQELLFLNKRFILEDEFFKSLGNLDDLNKLDLSYTEFRHSDNDFTLLSQGLSRLSKLTSIVLDSINLDNDGLAVILGTIKNNILELSLRRNNLIDEGIRKIVDYIGTNPRLKSIDLSFNKFKEDALKELAKSLMNLKELEILKLENVTNLNIDGMLSLLKDIKSSTNKLNTLNVYFPEPIKLDEHLIAIAGVVNEMTELKNLKINTSRELLKYLTINCKLINKQ